VIAVEVTTRRCSKVLLVDEQERVLLFSGIDRTKPELRPWWFAIGGRLEAGETYAQAAVRETFEETGLTIGDPGPVVFTRLFRWEFEGETFDQEERFYFIRVSSFTPTPAAWTETEVATIREMRWWSVEALRSTDEIVFPDDLAAQLERLLAG
jgi:8-oxo-dGTP pyrophosphatase MutT (NUDIX family)